MLTTKAYNALALIAAGGAVALAILERDAAQVAAFLGFAGTLAGRGRQTDTADA